jgi:hypothetical protein
VLREPPRVLEAPGEVDVGAELLVGPEGGVRGRVEELGEGGGAREDGEGDVLGG